MLIQDISKLNEQEMKFTRNIHTHTDFVIYNQLDNMPVLVVEVDGYAFNPKQIIRDKMKDDILKKYDIPIIRIKKNQS
jgi:very-short-patch-repair endonuclease